MTTRDEIARLATLVERYAQWKKGDKILISHTWQAEMRAIAAALRSRLSDMKDDANG